MIRLIKNIFKRSIKRFINYFGYELRGIKPIIAHNNYDAIHKFIINRILKIESPIIFDVGANDGESIKRFSKIFPNLKIYSFEPDDETFKRLKKRYSDIQNIYLNNFGLSNKDTTQKFYSYSYDKMSSLIPLDTDSKLFKSRKIAKNNDENFEKEKMVQLHKLDSFAKKKNISRVNVLKIDVQGCEPEVIEGACDYIEKNKIDIIEMEIILGFGYSKSISFYDVEKYFSKYGYKLIAINHDSNIISYSNYQVDVIYVNNFIFKEIKNIHKENITIEGVTRKTDTNNPYSY